jgi:hypothetical protein
MIKLTRLMLALFFFLSASGLSPTMAASDRAFQDEDQPPTPEAATVNPQVFLPLMVQSQAAGNIVRGQVTSEEGSPIAGVTITSDAGETATTNANGEYSLEVDAGPAFLAADKTCFMFSPSMLELNVAGTMAGQNFTALANCSEVLSNLSFESTAWWNLVPGGYPATYSDALAHSGLRSVRMGIPNAEANQLAESRVRSPAITIPENANGATLRMWLYPVSGESPASVMNLDRPSAEQMEPPVIDSAFGDATMLYDAQFVRVLDASDAPIGTLMYVRSNNQYWSFHQFDLTPFAGRTIKLEIGAYNDGTDGVTSLYMDDVSLSICATGSPPPVPSLAACANQVANSSFEYNGSWNLPSTSYPAMYSYYRSHTGARSMRTGIPLGAASNAYSYSDAWQTVYVPSSGNARLKMWLHPRSEEPAASADVTEVEAQTAPNVPEEGKVWDQKMMAPDAPDAQYVLILNPNTGAIRRTLIWWTPLNAAGWLYREFDVSAFAGQYIRIQFGTFNNGTGGLSRMFVDDLTLEVCTTPPPPPVCSERITNGGFEGNAAWYIPNTAFSAGYSTYLRQSGARSMRTGIVYWYHNRYSYSDARQAITIPANTRNATLRFGAYMMSGETFADVAMDEKPSAEQMAAVSPTSGSLGAEAMAGDVQYLLILDRYGNWIDTLLWQRTNANYWRNFSFSLNRYIGQTIQLQWGTFNNGTGGVTSMYVDNVSLQACP